MTNSDISEHQRRVFKHKMETEGLVNVGAKDFPLTEKQFGNESAGVESKLQQQVIQYIQGQKGYFVIRNAFGKRTRAVPGTPDLCLCILGRMVCIELKTPEGKLSDDQKIVMEKLIANGADYNVCRSFEEVVKVVRDAEAKPKL